jgi:hypothetical protein
MILEPNTEYKNTRERYQQKALRVSKHLAEYRMASKEILAALLSQRVTSTARFFAQLEREKIIVPFTNFHSSKSDLVRLGPLGATMVDGPERENTRNLLRSDKLESNERVIHDLLVQAACIDGFNTFKNVVEMVSDYNIQSSGNIADSYLINEKQQILAIEMESSRKSRDRIYFTLTNYIKMIEENEIQGVVFYFLRESDQKYYASLFSESAWPIYRTVKRGKFLDLRSDGTLEVLGNSWIRDRFKFRLMKSSKPPLMKHDPSRVWSLPDMGYKERLTKIAEDKVIEKERAKQEEKARQLENQRLKDLRDKEDEAKRAEARRLWEEKQLAEAAAREAEERRKNSLMGRLFG